jgi:hypothetical protein
VGVDYLYLELSLYGPRLCMVASVSSHLTYVSSSLCFKAWPRSPSAGILCMCPAHINPTLHGIHAVGTVFFQITVYVCHR